MVPSRFSSPGLRSERAQVSVGWRRSDHRRLQRRAAHGDIRGALAAGAVGSGEAVCPEGAMKGVQIGDPQPRAPGLAIPVRRQHREGEAKLIHLALVDIAPVVGRIEEVGHPRCGVAGGNGRSAHAGELQDSRARDGRRGGLRVDRGLGGVSQILGDLGLRRSLFVV